MRLYLIRHLFTAWNTEGLLQGRRDLDVLKPDAETLGRIARNREHLDRVRPDMVFVSSLKRTQQTAAYYGYSDVIVDERLDELDFGPFEGHARKEMEEELGSIWREMPQDVVLGESLHTFCARIKDFLCSLSDGEKVLVFGHGAWLRALISLAQRGDISQMNRLSIKPNKLTEVSISRTACLRSGN